MNVTVRVSLDNGNTWPHSVLVDTLGGYVTVEMISEDLVGVLYDKGADSLSLSLSLSDSVCVLYDTGADCGPVAFASINATELVSRSN